LKYQPRLERFGQGDWEPKLSLAQKLAAFDPALHDGEVMATRRPVGNEAF